MVSKMVNLAMSYGLNSLGLELSDLFIILVILTPLVTLSYDTNNKRN